MHEVFVIGSVVQTLTGIVRLASLGGPTLTGDVWDILRRLFGCTMCTHESRLIYTS